MVEFKMKRHTDFFCVITFFVLTAALSGCKINFSESESLKGPEVRTTVSGIGVIITKRSQQTKYIDVFRKKADEADTESVHIAKIFPASQNSSGASYFFEDLYFEAAEYKYRVRWSEPNGEYTSSWSEAITPTGKAKTTDEISYNFSNANISVNTESKELKITSYSAPSDSLSEFSHAMIVTNESGTQTFDVNSYFVDSETIKSTITIPLAGILPEDFKSNGKITVLGFVPQKKNFADEENTAVKEIIWGLPSYEKGKNGLALEITLTSGNNLEGYTY